MIRLHRGLALALLLATFGASVVLADEQFCVTDDLNRCSENIPRLDATVTDQDLAVTDLAATAPDAAAVPEDLAAVPEDLAATPPDEPQSAITTRTIGPPTLVNPFAGTAAPAITPSEVMVPRSVPPPDQKLPPGPPNRFP